MSVYIPRVKLLALINIMEWFAPYVFKIDKKIHYSKVVNVKSI